VCAPDKSSCYKASTLGLLKRTNPFFFFQAEDGIRVVVSLMDFHLVGGMLKGERLMSFFQRHFMDCPIDALEIPFAAVATDLHTGQEVWLRDGSTTEVVRASIALPGLFSPVWLQERLLVDGGL